MRELTLPIVFATSVVLTVAMPPTAAVALTQQQFHWCANDGNAFAPDLQISGCTAAIESGIFSGKSLAFAFNMRGWAYYQKNDYDRAIADYNQAIRLSPNYATAFYYRSLAKEKKGDTASAEADLAAARRIAPNIGR